MWYDRAGMGGVTDLVWGMIELIRRVIELVLGVIRAGMGGVTDLVWG